MSFLVDFELQPSLSKRGHAREGGRTLEKACFYLPSAFSKLPSLNSSSKNPLVALFRGGRFLPWRGWPKTARKPYWGVSPP